MSPAFHFKGRQQRWMSKLTVLVLMHDAFYMHLNEQTINKYSVYVQIRIYCLLHK